MADLPLLLLGPILRRVEPQGVSVFMATSKAATVRVAVYDGQVDVASLPPELGSFETQTTQFAASFHAAVVVVSFADAASLQPGHLYSYDVGITPAGGSAQTLKDLKLLGIPALAAGEKGEDVKKEAAKSLLKDASSRATERSNPRAPTSRSSRWGTPRAGSRRLSPARRRSTSSSSRTRRAAARTESGTRPCRTSTRMSTTWTARPTAGRTCCS